MSTFPNPSVDCQALSQLFTEESGRIAPEIQQRMSGRNIVLDMTPKGVWPDGMGDIVNVLTVERSFTTGTNDDDVWTPITTASTPNNNQACLPSTVGITTGQSQRQMQISRRAIESPDICLELLRNDFMIERQLDITFSQLTNALQWELEKHAMNEYISQSANLTTMCPNGLNSVQPGQEGAANFSTANVPTAILDQGFLDTIYDQYVRDTYGDGSVGQVDGAYIYTLITEQTTSRSLIRDNVDIRQDERYAYEGDRMESDLLLPYGVKRSYGNFAHVICNHMPRYDFVNGAYVRRNFWNVSPAATKGLAPVVNQQYLSAEFTTSFIYNPKVYKWLVPGMINAPGGTTGFQTPNYFPAQFKWLNIQHRECNPDNTIGFFRSVMASASMPLLPNYGWVILHQRAIPPTTYTQYYV